MREGEVKIWMRRLAEETPAGRMPAADEIWARAALEAELENRRRAQAPFDWIEAAWQSLALSGVAALSVWLGDLFS